MTRRLQDYSGHTLAVLVNGSNNSLLLQTIWIQVQDRNQSLADHISNQTQSLIVDSLSKATYFRPKLKFRTRHGN